MYVHFELCQWLTYALSPLLAALFAFFILVWPHCSPGQTDQLWKLADCLNSNATIIVTTNNLGKDFLFAFPFFPTRIRLCVSVSVCMSISSKRNQPQICGKTPLLLCFDILWLLQRKQTISVKFGSFYLPFAT